MPTRRNKGRSDDTKAAEVLDVPDAIDTPIEHDRANAASFTRVGDLRAALARGEATWEVAENLGDDDPLPNYPLGGDLGSKTRASEAAPVRWDEAMRVIPPVPGLVERRLELGVVPEDLVDVARAIIPTGEPPIDVAPPIRRPTKTAGATSPPAAKAPRRATRPAKKGGSRKGGSAQ
jgi:hypothetical protein